MGGEFDVLSGNIKREKYADWMADDSVTRELFSAKLPAEREKYKEFE
jgi:hypothetical protein